DSDNFCQNNTLTTDLDLSWNIPRDSVEKITNFLRITRYSKALKLITLYEENLELNRLRIEVIEAVVKYPKNIVTFSNNQVLK
ncbi:31014_t:CDS:1, partial [Gigaspora margarita]